ncbi:hypothetical protein THAOC_00790, partial [Thalassiosira oceanica]
KALQKVTVPSTVTELGNEAFKGCDKLVEVQLNEGMQKIGKKAFQYCIDLRSVTIPSTVTLLDEWAFHGCSNLSEVILMGGERLLDKEFFSRGVFSEQPVLNQEILEIIGQENKPWFSMLRVGPQVQDQRRNITMKGGHFSAQERSWPPVQSSHIKETVCREGSCRLFEEILPLKSHDLALAATSSHRAPPAATTDVPFGFKISIPWALPERFERLPKECKLSVAERIQSLPRLELMLDCDVFAHFLVVVEGSGDEAGDNFFGVQDTHTETARSLYQIFQLLAFHELKESSVVVELAMWKSRIDGKMVDETRKDCRVPIPDPAKSLIMRYCFAGFLEPTIESS